MYAFIIQRQKSHKTLWIIKFTIKQQLSNKTTKILDLGKIKQILISKDQNILKFKFLIAQIKNAHSTVAM